MIEIYDLLSLPSQIWPIVNFGKEKKTHQKQFIYLLYEYSGKYIINLLKIERDLSFLTKFTKTQRHPVKLTKCIKIFKIILKTKALWSISFKSQVIYPPK